MVRRLASDQCLRLDHGGLAGVLGTHIIPPTNKPPLSAMAHRRTPSDPRPPWHTTGPRGPSPQVCGAEYGGKRGSKCYGPLTQRDVEDHHHRSRWERGSALSTRAGHSRLGAPSQPYCVSPLNQPCEAEPRSVLVVESAAMGFDDDHSIGRLAIGDRRGGPAEDSYRPNLRGRDLVQDLKTWRCS